MQRTKMKRNPDREVSPRNKRPRSSYSDHDRDSSRDRLSPDLDRRDSRDRGGGRDKPPKQYRFDNRDFESDLSDPHRQYRSDRMSDGGYGHSLRTEARTPEYRSLIISGIPNKGPDIAIKDILYREFKKYGEMNIYVMHSGDHRVAYVNFRYPEDARAAKHSKVNKVVLFDRLVRIEPVYPKQRQRSPGRDGHPPPRDGPPDHFRDGYFMNREASPPPRGRPNYRSPVDMGPCGDLPPREFRGDFGPMSPQDGSNRRGNSEKFPYHLHHIMPEDDDKATRTLFIGNLDYNIHDAELRKIFERFGVIEEIDIKRPQRGMGNAYAFVKFINLDYAHRAKVEMSGKYIGRFHCKIGYGKVNPTTCLWVGGLGPWISHETLEREFDRFGVIHRIEWPQGKNYAYVLYDSIDAAQAACQEMRGFPLGGQDRRLRVDFADANQISNVNQSPAQSPRPAGPDADQFNDDRNGNRGFGPSNQWRNFDDRNRHPDDWRGGDNANSRNPDNVRDSDGPRGRDNWNRSGPNDRHRRRSPDNFNGTQRKHSKSPDRFYDGPRDGRDKQNRQNLSQERDGHDATDADKQKGVRSPNSRHNSSQSVREKDNSLVQDAENLNDMAKCLPVAWKGPLILKSSAFAARMHVVSGNVTIVDNLMRDPSSTETPVLTIKQRLRLDQPKLDDVGRRVTMAGEHDHCILLALPGTLQNYNDQKVQQRPLKNLVTYLKEKKAAGVISLPPYPVKDKENVGMLHAFPPCEFGYEYLRKEAPKLPPELDKDDYLVIVVVRGAA